MRSKIISIFISLLMIMNIFGAFAQNVGGPNSVSIPIEGLSLSNNSLPNPQFIGSPSPVSSGSGGLADSPWPMFRQNLNHTGVSPYDTSSNPGKLKWRFETGDRIRSSPAIGSDGTIYIGSNDHKLYAINPDGTEKWNFSTGDKVKSSPVIDSNGTIYVGSDERKLYAINPDGTEKWSFITVDGLFSSPAIGYDGTIYIGAHGNKIYAINCDGTEKWIFTPIGSVTSSPAIGSDGTIYIGTDHPGKHLYAIYPNGTEKWNFMASNDIMSSPAIGSDGTIYVGSNDGKLYAINSDGTEKWSYFTDDPVISSPAIGSNGTIYVGCWNGNLYAFNPNGSERWNFSTGRIIYRSSPAIGADGTIFIGSTDYYLYAINPDGTKRWMFNTNGEVASSPAIGADGTIYIGSYNGKLNAIGTLPFADAGLRQTLNEGEVVHFNGSASYDPDGIIINYEWDFDLSDGLWWETGDTPDATGPTPTHIYGDDGIYKVTLRVTEDKGGKDTDTCIISIKNIAPTISSISVPSGNEGSVITFASTSTDPGSDDLTFTWNWGDGTSETTSIHYNDEVSPDPYPSPTGIFPFSASDTVQHTYGDNGEYLITLTVEDDDGGSASINSNIIVNNVVPTISLMLAPSGDEGASLTFTADATDPGSDDLTFLWEFEYGPTIENIYYNNKATPDPPTSPLGVYPFNVIDNVTHTYGDNYNYSLSLTVTDDDGGIATYTTTVSVDNVAPFIMGIMVPYVANEGQSATYSAVAYDEGSDDLTFEWDFGDSTPTITNTYYNDGTGPDPCPSPNGLYPFYANDNLNHTYGDDYNYTLTLKVTDDDGGFSIFSGTVFVYNVAPSIEPFGPFTVDEGLSLEIIATCTDPGSDDLTFTWEFELGPDFSNIYYNDGTGPDMNPSPGGIFPFLITDLAKHIYGDNGVYNVTLTVEDDDGGVNVYITNITVNNVAPTILNIDAYMYVNFTIRVAGEKYHTVNITLFEDDKKIWDARVTRQPGDPNEQVISLTDYKISLESSYTAIVDYLPNDPRVNGNVWGANPVWIIMEFQDGTTEKLHHTFNVKKSYWDSDHWNHIDPWEVDLTSIILKHNITFEATAIDPGSDDLTFNWDFGDGGIAGPNTYFNNGISPDPFPSPEINPIQITDTVLHAYNFLGIYTVTISVKDDDEEITSITFIIGI